ncbi:MAG: hypothetical protein ACI4PO_01835 [Faecousia sp.]
MQLTKYFDFRMNFKRSWTSASGALMGVALFSKMVYYFGLTDIGQCGFFEILFSMALPVLLCACYIILLRFVKLNAPGIFAILGAVLYFLVMVDNIHSGGVLRVVLSLAAYLTAIFLLIATVAGYLPDKIFVLAIGFLIPVFRFFLYDLGGGAAAAGMIGKIRFWTLSISNMAILAALFCLPMCMRPAKT